MKKGFTLIELLAVIVILAIIALIATPIILGIINDARKESNERSAELYASAVRNAIASYQLAHLNAPTKFSDLTIQHDGEVECAKEELYLDGSFYIAECRVNGYEVDYTYGEQQITQVYKPQYYWFDMSSPGYIGEGLPSSAKSKVSDLEIQGKPIYLGLDVDSKNKVIASYACFIRNETEYCIKAASDDSTYETNVEIIKYAYEDVVNTNACSFDEEVSSCRVDELSVSAYSYGDVTVYADSVLCMFTNDYNTFECFDA